MPDKQLTIATYAAGASLAAITLVYVFAPTFFIDGEAESSASSRKRGIVGLYNPANDCFINSTVQALAGLGDLRLYLIRETHRRTLDGSAVYKNLVEDPTHKNQAPWKLEGLQEGIVTHGLKDLLDNLNERPIYRKTISVLPFVKCLESAFKQRISRQQQDAQEFLQVVAERLCDEYHAGQRARRRARDLGRGTLDDATLQRELTRLTIDAAEEEESMLEGLDSVKPSVSVANATSTEKPDAPLEGDTLPPTANRIPIIKSDVTPSSAEEVQEDEEGFPLEGGYESQIECLTCGFKPKPNLSTFCTLTLNVPALPSTTLSACFDGIFKTEYIEEFKCAKCRLIHGVETLQRDLTKSQDAKSVAKTQQMIERIQHAIETDPENPSDDLALPDARDAPKRKIMRHIKITSFPKVLAVHLSRSIYDNRSSMKNAAKVAFPENLPLGGLLHQKQYKLLAVVTHKGSHHSGHYETFRRQQVTLPFVNVHPFERNGVYSKCATPAASAAATPAAATPQLRAVVHDEAGGATTPEIPTPAALGGSSRVSLADSASSPTATEQTAASSASTAASIAASTETGHSSKSRSSNGKDADATSLRSITRSSIARIRKDLSRSVSRSPSKEPRPGAPRSVQGGAKGGGPFAKAQSARKHRKACERWWRISDDKVKECKTGEVLGMQREVYLLFYEMVR